MSLHPKMNKVILKPLKAKPFWKKESIVFSGAIDKIEGDPTAAELVTVYSDDHRLVGQGFFNPFSSYRVRLIAFADEKTLISTSLPDIIEYRLRTALKKRQDLNLPNSLTTAYRLLNSEGDFLSGLTIDIFDQALVIANTAYWAEVHQKVIIEIIKKIFPINNIIWRSNVRALQQDGWKEAIEKNIETLDNTIIQENGLKFLVDLKDGQKTGFYCDQRENRFMLRSFCKNKTVLDCYCYSGGFALNVASAGAKKVLGIDSSVNAITLAQKNADLNYLTQATFSQEKVENFLTGLGDDHPYNLIILDPPKFSPSKKNIAQAKQQYFKLNQLALKLLPNKGLLLTCSCSDAITTDIFLDLLKKAAKTVKKRIRIIKTGAAAPDHPVPLNQQYGNYLKVVLLEVLSF